MNDEKQMILEMLKEGKITVEEANALLEAIGGKKARPDNDFLSKLNQSIESVIKKTTETFETISNIDFENIDINQYNIRGEINTHKEMRIEDEINHIRVEIKNGRVAVERATDSAITVTQDIWSKRGDLVDYLNIEIKDDVLVITVSDEYDKQEASALINIALGKNLYESLHVEMVNGAIEVADVDFNHQNIDTVNAKTTIINSSGEVDIDNVNGKVDIKNTKGNLKVNNVNGQIYLTNVSGDKAVVDAVSGNVRIDGPSTKEIFAKTYSGNVRIYNIGNVSEMSLESANGNIVVDTETFTGDVKVDALSQGLLLADKFRNKMQIDGGYQVSTNLDKDDLRIRARATSGKISLR